MTGRETITFEKWEGLGNDFILVPARALHDAQVRALCDRRLGVGADGVLLIDRGEGDRPRMTVRNADGSRPEMCGNGLRCVAGFLGEQVAEGEATPRALVVATDAGDRPCALRRCGPGDWEVEVEMGRAVVDGEMEVPLEGRVVRFASIDMGNPHMVTFDAVSAAERDHLAPRVERIPPRGTNVELCMLREGGAGPVIELVVWERGVGYTQACGTGACAAVVAAAHAGLVPFGAPVRVELPGGGLEIAVESGTLAVKMKGPARRVFTGVAVLG